MKCLHLVCSSGSSFICTMKLVENIICLIYMLSIKDMKQSFPWMVI